MGSAVLSILGLATLISANQIGTYWPYGTLNFEYGDSREYYDIPHMQKIKRNDYEEHFNETTVAFRASIQSELVQDNHLKLFIVSWNIFDKPLGHFLRKNGHPLDNSKSMDTNPVATDSTFSNSLNDFFVIRIDGEPVSNLQWKSYKHPSTTEEGYLTYIDIIDLARTQHTVEIYAYYFDKQDSVQLDLWEKIDFWKD